MGSASAHADWGHWDAAAGVLQALTCPRLLHSQSDSDCFYLGRVWLSQDEVLSFFFFFKVISVSPMSLSASRSVSVSVSIAFFFPPPSQFNGSYL